MNPPLPQIKVCQIIAFAMMMGIVAFAGIAVVSRSAGADPQPLPAGADQNAGEAAGVPMLFIAIGFATVLLFARAIVLTAMDRRLRREPPVDGENPAGPESLIGHFQTRLIVGLAMLEGPAFFCLIAYMVEGRWEALALTGYLLFVMAINFPTETKLRNWFENIRVESNYAGGR